jgi:hypothetical protein
MNEQQPDAQPQAPAIEAQRDPVVFAPRITPELREQIEGVRRLTGQTINELGTEALTDWVAKKLADEDLRTKALAEIDAEEQRLQERRSAIVGILGAAASEPVTSGEPASDNPAPERASRRSNSRE